MKFSAWCIGLFLLLSGATFVRASDPVVITVDASKSVGVYKPAWNYFGADEPNYTYAPNGEKLLRELGGLTPAPVYFRTHNLLTTGDGSSSLKWGSTNAYRENPDGSPLYDWTITDRIFDALIAAHVRPLVEVGFMPEALSTHPEPYRHDFPKGDVFTGWSYPPKDYAKWSALVTAWAHHLHGRYGAQVDGWLWEVWNEPDIGYWHGTPEEYDRLYDVTAAAIRGELPQAKIGGPESTGPANDHAAAFLRLFLDHCAHGTNAASGKTGAPLDFISFHPKGNPKFIQDSAGGHVRMNVGAQLRNVQRGMEIVASYPEFRNTPIILGESDPEGCAACKGAQNGYRNGPLYGVSVAEAMMRTYELARLEKVRLQGAVTWAFEFEDQPYFAGFRELATNGIDKPVLNVFRMMGMLGGDWVNVTSSGAQPLSDVVARSVIESPDVNAVATRQEHEVDVLLWNYHDDDLSAEPAQVALALKGLPKQKARIEIYRMDADHANAYSAWQRMGSPQSPTAEQVREIEKSGTLEPERLMSNAAGDAVPVSVDLSLPRQGVSLVRVTW
ncbi:xylan 1,4-beta-xylosidase [Silvibacterium bohemicum]|uniref:Xylan 1,4-beta-xylosidase n=1 Tax=Silvibacterium bohemicum TaxID=1577686 RepID=A0A841JVN1_9BACT|nr:beta-xylosidase [Silvibacterium bohemicum]MBB6145406.1 xylan 1,4-beta-xylosidase [Silvibacterium bohemicum]